MRSLITTYTIILCPICAASWARKAGRCCCTITQTLHAVATIRRFIVLPNLPGYSHFAIVSQSCNWRAGASKPSRCKGPIKFSISRWVYTSHTVMLYVTLNNRWAKCNITILLLVGRQNGRQCQLLFCMWQIRSCLPIWWSSSGLWRQWGPNPPTRRYPGRPFFSRPIRSTGPSKRGPYPDPRHQIPSGRRTSPQLVQGAPCCLGRYCYLHYATAHTIRSCFREGVCSESGRGKKDGSSQCRMQRRRSVVCSPCCGIVGRLEPWRSPTNLQNRQTSGSEAWYLPRGSSFTFIPALVHLFVERKCYYVGSPPSVSLSLDWWDHLDIFFGFVLFFCFLFFVLFVLFLLLLLYITYLFFVFCVLRFLVSLSHLQ